MMPAVSCGYFICGKFKIRALFRESEDQDFLLGDARRGTGEVIIVSFQILRAPYLNSIVNPYYLVTISRSGILSASGRTWFAQCPVVSVPRQTIEC